MAVTTLTLSDFLLARIAEDEEAAGEVQRRAHGEAFIAYGRDWVIANYDEDRVLAECQAKRQIVEAYRELREEASRLSYVKDPNRDIQAARDNLILTARNMYAGVEIALRALVLPYADHPEFNPAWRS